MQAKSEKAKNLENELNDLEKWLELGLVPKENIKNHKAEIVSIKKKIKEEERKVQALKESGEIEEYEAPKRTQAKPSYTEGINMPDTTGSGSGGESSETSSTSEEFAEREVSDDAERGAGSEDPDVFGGRNRWNGDILDPDSDEW